MSRVPARALVAFVIVALGLAMAGPSAASTVRVRGNPDTVEPGRTGPASDEVHYVAAPGERNDLLVVYAADARAVVVHDPGAVIAAGESCTSIDAHTARCVPRPEAPTPWLQAARADLGDADDMLHTARPTPYPIGGVVAGGGPGDDRLDGGAGADRLDGGGGRDVLLGGAGFDVLSDGDRDDVAGGGPDGDVLDGGSGSDELSYARRRAAVVVDLEDPGTDGAPGEGDVVSGVEDVTGGSGDDRLTGDARPNTLLGGAGADVLIAGAGSDAVDGGPGTDRVSAGDGSDRVAGGAGADSVTCGAGRDTVGPPQAGEVLGRDCETARWAFAPHGEDTLSFAPIPRTDGARAMFKLGCPVFELSDGEPKPCAGLLTVREAGGRHRLLAARAVADDGEGRFDAPLWLNARGRDLAGRRGGVAVTVTLDYRGLRPVHWTVRIARP